MKEKGTYKLNMSCVLVYSPYVVPTKTHPRPQHTVHHLSKLPPPPPPGLPLGPSESLGSPLRRCGTMTLPPSQES